MCPKYIKSGTNLEQSKKLLIIDFQYTYTQRDTPRHIRRHTHNALRAMQGGSLYHFYDGLWYDPVGRRTHDLPCERRTR